MCVVRRWTTRQQRLHRAEVDRSRDIYRDSAEKRDLKVSIHRSKFILMILIKEV